MEMFLSFIGILILILCLIAIIKTISNPKFGLIVFIILLFARDSFLMYWFPIVYSDLHLPLVFGILTLISYILSKGGYPRNNSLQLWLMFAFFIAICLSRYFAGSVVFQEKPTLIFLKLCVLFFLIVNLLRTNEDIRHVIWTIILINVFMALHHYYYYKIGGSSIYTLDTFRGMGRNRFAGMLATSAALIYPLLHAYSKSIVKIFLLFCLFALAAGVVLTQSRAAALALGMTLLFAFIIDKKRMKFAPFFVIIIVIFGYRISGEYFARLETITAYKEEGSAMGRIATNYAAINMLKDSPVFGVGATNFPDVFLEYTPPDMREWVRPELNIHNIILQAASETGIIGLIIFLSLILKTFANAIKVSKLCFTDERMIPIGYTMTSLGLGFLCYFIAAQFGQGAYWGYLYIYIPLIVATSHVFEHSLFNSEHESDLNQDTKIQECT